MRNQQEIYIQTQNSGLRNRTIKNVNMSSDFCIFETPSYDIPNLTSVQCDASLCYLTGYSLTNILASATTECFGTGSTVCHTATTWTTKIYEDGDLKYSKNWYTTTVLSGVPLDALFINSVETGFNTLNYNFSKTGTTYEIDKIFGIKELKIDICVDFAKKTGLACPSGYVTNENNDGCQKISITAATFNGTGSTILAGDTDSAYLNYGTHFYPNIQSNGALPLYYIGNNQDLRDQTGGTINALNIMSNPANTFFVNNPGNTTDGRLNQIGLSASTTELVGFSKCIDISSGGTYYVGLAADNNAEFYLNGDLLVRFSGSVADNFKKWSVFPLELKSGKNIIEMYGINDISSNGAFAAEVYAPIDYQTLTGATSTGITGTSTIFSTAEFIGQQWQIGTSVGYSCPAGYSLDTCSTAFTCTQILRTGYTVNCSGTCESDCYNIETTNFQYIDNTSTGVYLIPLSGITLIETLINFTSNIDELENLSNLTFRYEIYKYDSGLDLFARPAVYISDDISYEAYTGCVETYLKYAEAGGLDPQSTEELLSELGCSDLFINFNNLSGDGDYLLKIFYQFDACTDFLKRIGVKIDTSIYDLSDRFNIYNQEFDKYFVGVYKAESPILTSNQGSETVNTTNNLPLFQESFIIDEETDANATGSTLTLLSRPDGDIFIALNGLVLSKNIDYVILNEPTVDSIYFNNNVNTDNLQPLIIQFYGNLEIGDVVNIVFTRQTTKTLFSEPILIDSFIPTGATNNQGSSKYYYNTTTQKYEIYLSNTPLENSNILLILNGIVLLNNIDYYQSVSNKKRIILEGVILVDDILTAVYYPSAYLVGDITETNNIIDWYITIPPLNSNGEFEIQYSPEIEFSTYDIGDTIQYSAGTLTYSGNLILSGSNETELYYRVKNHKKYISICGDIIDDVAYSDTIKVKIISNAINSY
jgi:hypothetical protein